MFFHFFIFFSPSSDTDLLERVLRIPLTYVDASESASETHDESVVIHLSPDAEGVFGFNVRGGGGAPVLVSRVAARTRDQLQQGDQVKLNFSYPT